MSSDLQKGISYTDMISSLDHWKLKVIMMPTLSSMVAQEVVVTTHPGVGSDDNVGIMTTPDFQLSNHATVPFVMASVQ